LFWFAEVKLDKKIDKKGDGFELSQIISTSRNLI